MTQGDTKISEGDKIWADSKIHTYPITYTVFLEDITTIHPGNQEGFHRNRMARSSHGKIPLLILRKLLSLEDITEVRYCPEIWDT